MTKYLKWPEDGTTGFCVVGVPDEKVGEIIKAFVVASGTSKAGIISSVAVRLLKEHSFSRIYGGMFFSRLEAMSFLLL